MSIYLPTAHSVRAHLAFNVRAAYGGDMDYETFEQGEYTGHSVRLLYVLS